MKGITVFHGGEVIREADDWINSGELPVGALIRDGRQTASETTSWCRVIPLIAGRGNTVILLNERDLPNWVRAWLLVLT